MHMISLFSIKQYFLKHSVPFSNFSFFDLLCQPRISFWMEQFHIKHIFNEGKVKSCLCFFLKEHHARKAYWGSGNIAPCIL